MAEELNTSHGELLIAHQKLHEAYDEMVQADKMASLGVMAGTVAHDIANPLTVILGEVQMLMMEETIDRHYIEEHCHLIEQHARKIHRLLQSIRTFARKSTGEPLPTDVHQPIEEALILVGKLLSTHQITVVRDDTTDLPLVMADSNRLEQVFMNLFQNAAQAMPDGGTITITTRHHPLQEGETRGWRESPVVGQETPVESRSGGTQQKKQGEEVVVVSPSLALPLSLAEGGEGKGWVEVSVTDTGPGIPHEHLDKVFDAFFTTKPSGQGTGLGLSICRRIVQEHGGEISVQSEIGKGACFTVLLPAVVEEYSERGKLS
jgi:signal transduction histidine kinase